MERRFGRGGLATAEELWLHWKRGWMRCTRERRERGEDSVVSVRGEWEATVQARLSPFGPVLPQYGG